MTWPRQRNVNDWRLALRQHGHAAEVATLLEHPNVLSTRPTVRWEHGRQVTIYVVETDLAVMPEDPAYDAAALRGLAKLVRAHVADVPHFVGIRFEQVPLA